MQIAMTKRRNNVQIFTDSAGALLLALGLALLLANLASLGLIQPHDPVLKVSMDTVFWIGGTLLVGFALVCLFAKSKWLRLALILWLAVDFVVYQVGLHSMGVIHGFSGYLASLSSAFGISPKLAELTLNVAFAYLLLGGCVCAVWIWWNRRDSLKMTCAACGGHIAFTVNNLGRQTACPHCKAGVILREPGNLKMSCFFCKEHIEFPAHALGQKIKCPHCKNDITLKESA
jgi:DNA-directed RNA polymerase subunit RPC12/RpoP